MRALRLLVLLAAASMIAGCDYFERSGDPTGPPPSPMDTDTDGDTVLDSVDNCISTPNPDQADIDTDGLGNACDPYNRAVVMVDIEGSAMVSGYEFELSYPNTVTLRCDVPGDSKTCLEPTGLFSVGPMVRASESPQRIYAKVTISSSFDPFMLVRTGALVTFDINPGAPPPDPSEFVIVSGHALSAGGSVIPGLTIVPRVVFGN